ncbi:GGDEF domain-containing protein [Anaerosinus massiliensis]|uniref:GGDEF domain-containing protein n=1 Tax=Massilibacillus massiliensis TaxID=1806837 RepID=UPI000AB7FA64|nr:GGDEF domain-containing protein [Massilibacillus massiliensis]
MLQNTPYTFSQINHCDYYNSHWKKDVKLLLLYIGMISGMTILGLWHDFMLISHEQSAINKFTKLCLYNFKGATLLISLLFALWLVNNLNKQAHPHYAKYVFIWELCIVFIAIFSNLNRPQTYYLTSVIEIPVILSMYLIIPQYKRILRILPPIIFSVSLACIYMFYKTSPQILGFSTLYMGLFFVNLIGIYYADTMYAKDYQLFQLSNIDALTRLYNRRYFQEKLQENWLYCLQNKKPLAICLLDIDYFKKLNDTYGHPYGDEVLKKVAAELVKKTTLPNAFVARYGGEEIIVSATSCTLDAAKNLAETLRSSIESLKLSHETSEICSWVTVSIGVSSIIPTENTMQEVLLQQADLALYKAKEQGRNQVMTYISPCPNGS